MSILILGYESNLDSINKSKEHGFAGIRHLFLAYKNVP
ncbi:hypothetical protein PanWU01x14_048310 [Parasponia andersonii]|uniref:Uncharacterized protein n=1 Tax=Parasponia andersonii TaxID=3476 RepID=A0A2P5DNB2_PARAD|nr:hypothetical protein PanWU01x14_048310 [Parasponia andersonii]